MRVWATSLANAVAWLGIGALIVGAMLVTNRLGFLGLGLLGSMTCLVCTRATLDQQVPTWSVGAFKAAMDRPRSSQERAGTAAEHRSAIAPLRFYFWCGAVLAAIGAMGVVWQIWSASPPQ